MKTIDENLWENPVSVEWEGLYSNALSFINWCEENCKGCVSIRLLVTDFEMDGEVISYTPEEFAEHYKYYSEVGDEALDTIRFHFNDSEDAVLFKLRWV